jgi:hypothetical protein
MPATVAARTRRTPASHRGPVRTRTRTSVPRERRTPISPAASLASRARGLPDSGLVHRIAQGRLWIGILGVLLAGIVALNVGSLSLSSGAGQALERGQRLDRQNSELRSKLARALSAEHLERSAAKIGMVVPDPGAIRYLTAARRDSRQAAKRLLAGLPAPEPLPQPTPPVPVPAATPAAPQAATPAPTAAQPAAQPPMAATGVPTAGPAATPGATAAAPTAAAAGGVQPGG